MDIMRNRILFWLLFFPFGLLAQGGTWVWLGGDSTTGSTGSFGTMGIPSPNNMPMSTYESCFWTDKDNNFWLFGGINFGLETNSLWKYDIITNQWTWMKGQTSSGSGTAVFGTKGVPSPLNYPESGEFGVNCWTDSVGDLWMYGGFGNNTLWRYHIPTNEWTWMQGDQNWIVSQNDTGVFGPLNMEDPSFRPGSRGESKSSWVRDNKLVLFGGQTVAGYRNDLWAYNISTNNWAFIGGTSTHNHPGNFGVKGVEAASNVPSGRLTYSRWEDDTCFYLFGGNDDFPLLEVRNDVWKYNWKTKMWTWISGSNLIKDTTYNPTYCIDENAGPPSRFENISVTAKARCARTCWTFGGRSGYGGDFNDLWAFNTESNKWKRISGTSYYALQRPYDYGVKGIPSTTNLPRAKEGIAMWSDQLGQVYIFGGADFQVPGINFNDFWKFIPDTNCIKAQYLSFELKGISDTSICTGDSVAMNFPIGITLSVFPNQNFYIDNTNKKVYFFPTTNTTYTVIGTSFLPNDPCFPNDTVRFTITTSAAPVADFNVAPSIAILPNSTFNCINNSSNNAIRYEWFDESGFISNAKDIVKSYTKEGKYCITLVAYNSCEQSDSITKCVEVKSNGSVIVPNIFSPNGDPNNPIIKPIFIGNVDLLKFTIYNRWGEVVFKTISKTEGWDGQFKNQPCEVGTYYYYIEVNDVLGAKKIYKGDINLIR